MPGLRLKRRGMAIFGDDRIAVSRLVAGCCRWGCWALPDEVKKIPAAAHLSVR